MRQKKAGLIEGILYTLPVLLIYFIQRIDIPYRSGLPHDPGIFQYIAWRISEGDVIYRDIWDHKGPAFHLVNGLAFALTGSLWGLWLLQLVILIGSVYLCARITKHWLPGLMLAALLALYMSLGRTLLAVEFYVIPLQLLGVYALLHLEHNRRMGIVLGATGMIALLIRPNLAGLWLAAGLYLLFWQRQTVRDAVKYIVTGALLVGTPVLLYLALNGALKDAFDIYVRFNLEYSNGRSSVIAPLAYLFRWIPIPVVILSALGLVFLPARQRTLLVLCVLTEYLMLIPGGAGHFHYYLPIFYIITLSTEGLRRIRYAPVVKSAYALAATFVLLQAITLSGMTPTGMSGGQRAVLQQVQQSPGSVFVLGDMLAYNAIAERYTGTRYPYLNRHMLSIALADEPGFWDALRQNPPALVLDMQNTALLDGAEMAALNELVAQMQLRIAAR